MTSNRLEVLRELRPTIALDDVWDAQQQTAVRERILRAAQTPPAAPSIPRRKAAVAIALALGLAAAPGLAAAAGSGMKPQAFVGAYAHWGDNPDGSVAAAGARRVASAPGPFGGVFTVVAASNRDGVTCLTPVFETSESSTRRLPDDFEGGADFCQKQPNAKPFGVDGVTRGATAMLYSANAGNAVRAQLWTADGRQFPAVLAEGYLFGWWPLPSGDGPGDSPTLIGYGANGEEIGRIQLL